MGVIQSLFGSAKSTVPPTPAGAAPYGPEPDKRKLVFFLVKKYTSYTYAKLKSDQWTAFINAYEAMLRSKDDPYEHEIETFKYLLDPQIAYEKGLAKLRVGDRSVFNYKSGEGYLMKARPSGTILRRFDEAGLAFIWPGWVPEDAYVAKMAETYLAYANGCGSQGFGIASEDGATYNFYFDKEFKHFSPSLPQIPAIPPEPKEPAGVVTGKSIKLNGIYEPIDDKGYIIGCPNYLLAGLKAPRQIVEFGPRFIPEGPDVTWESRLQNVIWRLMWEDKRYLDGSIPDEEVLYLVGEEAKPVLPATQTSAADDLLAAHSGQKVIRAGTWVLQNDLQVRQRFALNDTLPQHQGREVIWVWTQP